MKCFSISLKRVTCHQNSLLVGRTYVPLQHHVSYTLQARVVL